MGIGFAAASAAGDPRAYAEEFASARIAEPTGDRRVLHAQAAAVTTFNVVFAETTHNNNMVAE